MTAESSTISSATGSRSSCARCGSEVNGVTVPVLAPRLDLIAGADPAREIDALFVNAPLLDYDERPRVNDFTLPVLGMAYIATYAAAKGFNLGVLDAEVHGLRHRTDRPPGERGRAAVGRVQPAGPDLRDQCPDR